MDVTDADRVAPRGPIARALPLGPALLRAADWFNDAFAERLQSRGWPRLSRSQAQLMLHIDAQGTHPAELARRLDISRQAMRELLDGMEAHGLVDLRPHPRDRRALLVTLTDRAHRLGFDAAVVQAEIDAELRARIGDEEVDLLERILAADWGDPPR